MQQEFSRRPDRAQVLDEKTTRLRWESYERTRLRNIGASRAATLVLPTPTQTRADVVSAQYFVGEVLQKEKETSEYVEKLKLAEHHRDATFKAVFEKKLNQEQARRHRAANVCSRTGGVLITAQIQ